MARQLGLQYSHANKANRRPSVHQALSATLAYGQVGPLAQAGLATGPQGLLFNGNAQTGQYFNYFNGYVIRLR